MITDYCAGCGLPLKPHPFAGRYYCCADAYWSEAEQSREDRKGHYITTGQPTMVCKHPTKPLTNLYFYRPAMGWV